MASTTPSTDELDAALLYNAQLKRKIAELKTLQAALEEEKLTALLKAKQAASKSESKVSAPGGPATSTSTPASPAVAAEAKAVLSEADRKAAGISDDLHHRVALTVGKFAGPPAAAVTASLEFKHVGDDAFVNESLPMDPIAFVSFDVRMVAGRSTGDEHREFWERIVQPIFSVPKDPELRNIKVNVQNIGTNRLRITYMIPNPKTIRKLEERRRERAAYAAAQAAGESLPTMPPPGDEDIIGANATPFDILSQFGIDFSKMIKKTQVRVELPHNFSTVQTPERLLVGDVAKARVQAEVTVDPNIIRAVIDGAVTTMGHPGDRQMADAANAYFGTFVRETSIAISIGDLQPIFDNVQSLSTDTFDMETELKNRMENGRSIGSIAAAYLIRGDIRRLVRLLVLAQASKRSYKYEQYAAMYAALKIITTLVSRDVEEVTGVHIRSKTGLGVSVALDGVLLNGAINDIVSSFNLEPVTNDLLRSRGVRGNMAVYEPL